jgi:hypothetical protein
MKRVYCESVFVSMKLVAFEIARNMSLEKTLWLSDNQSAWDCDDPIVEAIVRVRLLVVEDVIEPS